MRRFRPSGQCVNYLAQSWRRVQTGKHTTPVRHISTSREAFSERHTLSTGAYRRRRDRAVHVSTQKISYTHRRNLSDDRPSQPNNDRTGSHEPHKEYFQVPGHEPEPDLTPYVRNRADASQASAFAPPPPAYLQHHPGLQQQSQIGKEQGIPKTYFQNAAAGSSQGDSPFRRFLRSTFYTFGFLFLGIAAGTGLITREYLAPLYEEGSEEEQEIVEEILETLDESMLVFGLREDGWKEVDLSAPRLLPGSKNARTLASDMGAGPSEVSSSSHHKSPENDFNDVRGRAEGIGMGRSMVYQVLTGSKGLVGLKMFHHPSQDYSVMVFFTGFGVDGWPDVVHGGIITTLVEEAVQKHLDWYHQGQIERVVDIGVQVDFKKPVQPGEIYAIIVPPAVIEPVRDHTNLGIMSGSLQTGINRLKLVGLFMHLEAAPRVSDVTRHGGAAVEHRIEVFGRGTSPNIHAVGEVTMKIVSEHNSQQNQQDLLSSIADSNADFGGSRRREQDDDET